MNKSILFLIVIVTAMSQQVVSSLGKRPSPSVSNQTRQILDNSQVRKQLEKLVESKRNKQLYGIVMKEVPKEYKKFHEKHVKKLTTEVIAYNRN